MYNSSTELVPGTWSHLAFTYDGSKAKIYVNGVPAEVTGTTNTYTTSGNYVYIGRRVDPSGYNWFYQGDIDELSIYDRTLSDSDVQNIFKADSLGKCP